MVNVDTNNGRPMDRNSTFPVTLRIAKLKKGCGRSLTNVGPLQRSGQCAVETIHSRTWISQRKLDAFTTVGKTPASIVRKTIQQRHSTVVLGVSRDQAEKEQGRMKSIPPAQQSSPEHYPVVVEGQMRRGC